MVSIDELVDDEGSKWEDYDPSRPIMDMLGIIRFQRERGDDAKALREHISAFSHYSRAKYVSSVLRNHPGYGHLAPKVVADLVEDTKYLDQVLRSVIHMHQSSPESLWGKASGNDQWGVNEDEGHPSREYQLVENGSYDTHLGYHQNMQTFPPTFVHPRDSRSRASQQHLQASHGSNSAHNHEDLGYDRAPNSRRRGEPAEQTSITPYPPTGTPYDGNYITDLASSVAHLNMGASSPILPSTLRAPQAKSFHTHNYPSNRGLRSRASSRGPPRADHEYHDIARPSTVSGNYHRGPNLVNSAHSSRSNSPQLEDYYTAPIIGIQVDNIGGEHAEPPVQWPLNPTYVGDLEPMHYDTYNGRRSKRSPEHNSYSRVRARYLSAGNLARDSDLPPGITIVPHPPTLATSTERHPSPSRAHPVRERSLSHSGNYPMDPTNSVDSLDYYTANPEFLVDVRQIATATLTRELGYDHPQTIDSLELYAIDQMEQANWRGAETLLIDVLERRRQTQGNSHLSTIQSMSNLGWAYQGQGKLKDAVAIFNTALREIRKNNPEKNWQIVSDIQYRLSITRDKQGDGRDFAYSNRARDDTSIGVAASSGTNSLHKLGLQPMISSVTSPEEIMEHLTSRGCPDLTDRLDSDRCTLINSNGGYGDIWRGTLQSPSGRPIQVALKRLRKDKRMYKHLCAELYTWSKTNHQNVLELLGLAWFRSRLVMISPWMECGNVEDYIQDHPNVDRLTVSLQVVYGVDHLHEIPLVHGDLKARNIFVSGNGVVKVGDFGLAKLLGEQSLRFSVSGTQSVGTMRWTAPELFEEQSHRDFPSDIYALGMTLLEIVTGRIPFHDLSVGEVIAAVLAHHKMPRMPWEIQEMGRPGFDLWDILNACWARDPKQRPSAALILERVKNLVYERSHLVH